MKKERSRNRELVEMVKEWSMAYGLDDFSLLEHQIAKYRGFCCGFSPTMLKILFVCYNFDKDEALSNKLLTDLIPLSNIEELVVIFNKVTVFSDTFIGYCRQYARVKKLRPVISRIFKSLKITCEDAHVYCFDNMEESLRMQSIQRLFGTINTAEFKNTKDIVAWLIGKNAYLLPELTEFGYRNIRRIGKLDVFQSEFSPIHRSETIRIEYFARTKSFPEIYLFLYFNQFIYDPGNIKRIGEVFSEKMHILKHDTQLFSSYIDLLYNGVVCRMCKAQNLQRRHLGTVLLAAIFEHSPGTIDDALVMDLIYDLSSEVRNIAARLRKRTGIDIRHHINNLVTSENYRIHGASIALQDVDPELIFAELASRVSVDDAMVVGLMNCLNSMNYAEDKYSSIALRLYEKYKSIDNEKYAGECDRPSWNILRECCMHFKNIKRNDLLMDCMLHADHLGLVCLIKEIVDVSALDISHYVSKGIHEILNRSTTVRKSGGLSQYFVLLNNGPSSYGLIKRSLFDLVGTSRESHVMLKGAREHILFHTLNVFASVFDDCSDDHAFYLKLGFSCLDSLSFCVKNCGFVLLGTIFKKILTPQKTFDIFFLTRKDLREHLWNALQTSIVQRNLYSIFFLLFILQNTKTLHQEEKDLVSKCLSIGGFVSLKARDILDGKRGNGVLLSEPSSFSVCTDQPEEGILACILIYLNKRDSRVKETIKERYKIKDASFQYLIHHVVSIVKKAGCSDAVKTALVQYQAAARSSYCSGNVYRSDLDFDFIFELLQSCHLNK